MVDYKNSHYAILKTGEEFRRRREMALLNVEEETRLFKERLDSDFFEVDRAKNNGENYVKSGKHKRDTAAVEEFVESDAFNVIRNL